MFGIGENRELKDVAHKIGKIFHHQLTEAMKIQGEIFNNADEIAFTSGYLKEYFHQMFTHYNNSDHVLEVKLFKKTCDGVIPTKLWEICNRGGELALLEELCGEQPIKEIKQTGQAYERGRVAGVEDADETHFEGSLPSQLTKFLTGVL